MSLEQTVAFPLIRQKKTLAIAESCTGGLLTHRLTNISGSSKFFKLGIIAYSNDFKTKILKVPAKFLQRHDAVSSQVCSAMATGIRRLAKTDLGIALTGIAGPTGATPDKPVGLVYIALSSGKKDVCVKCLFKGTRVQIKQQAATQALKLLKKSLRT